MRKRRAPDRCAWLTLICLLARPAGATDTDQPTPSEPAPAPNMTPDATLDDTRVVLTVRSDLSPYDEVRYQLSARGSTLIVSQSKVWAGGYAEYSDVGLLAAAALDGFLSELDACRLVGLSDAADVDADADALVVYDLEVRHAGELDRHRWSDRQVTPGSPGWCATRILIDAYDSHGEAIVFRNLFWDEGEYGELVTSSRPAARLYVDGRDTGLTTPVFGVRLAPGLHMLRYVNDPLAIDREYDVTIVEGHTTRVDVELR